MAQAVLSQTKTRKKVNRTKWNLILDIALVLIFVVEQEQHFTGIPMHEVLGLIFGAALILHILLHLDWVIKITKSFTSKLIHESRVNYLLNLALFIDLVVVTVTGIMISRTLGLDLGVSRDLSHDMEQIHMIASELSLLLIGAHVAMHWKWIATNVNKYILFPVINRLKPSQEVS